MKTEGRKILIERYLSGDLNDSELAEFERMKVNDKAFQEELQFQTELMEAIRDDKKIQLRKTLNEIHNKNSRRFTLPVAGLSWKVQSIAATLLVLLTIGGGVVLNNLSGSSSDNELYETYFNPETSILNVRSATNTTTSIELGMSYFQEEKYAEAIEAFQAKPENLMGKLYTAYSLMHLNKFEQAEQEFDTILVDNDNLFTDQAEWNLGLCYLASGKTQEAKGVLNKIASGKTVYNKKALQLLTELGNN